MKIVIGVGQEEQAKNAMSMLSALRFPNTEVHLVHVIEQLNSLGWPAIEGMNGGAVARVIATQEEQAKQTLDKAKTEWGNYGGDCQVHFLHGLSANELLNFASTHLADLVVIGSNRLGRIKGALLGSVGRKAVISSTSSTMIVKKTFDKNYPLTAVIATDHSEYANKCIEELKVMAPQGLGRLVILTAYPDQLVKSVTPFVEHFKSDISGWIRSELTKNNEKLMESLHGLNCKMKSRVEGGPVNEVIAKVMAEENADLLIIGAQGRGFIKRLTMGSIALHQAVDESYSVLVLRT